jgi:hypothetical protein
LPALHEEFPFGKLDVIAHGFIKRFCCREHTRAKNLIYYLAENFRAELMV